MRSKNAVGAAMQSCLEPLNLISAAIKASPRSSYLDADCLERASTALAKMPVAERLSAAKAAADAILVRDYVLAYVVLEGPEHEVCEICRRIAVEGEAVPHLRCKSHHDKDQLTELSVGGFRCKVCEQYVWPRETVKPPDAPTGADYQQVVDHLAALGVYLEILEQAAGLPDRDDQWGKAANQAISHARSVLLALLFSVKTHCLLAGYLLDYKQMDSVTVTLRTRSSIDPDDDLEALIPTATACYSTPSAAATPATACSMSPWPCNKPCNGSATSPRSLKATESGEHP